MAQPSGGGDGRLPRDRPGNSATLVATWRRSVRELCRELRCGQGPGCRDYHGGRTGYRGGGRRCRLGRGRGGGGPPPGGNGAPGPPCGPTRRGGGGGACRGPTAGGRG